jgi:hypothetical protein
MSYITEFKDCVKGDLGIFRTNIFLQHQNRVGVHKVRVKDALTCFGNNCRICYECRTKCCYACKGKLCVCTYGEGNIRLNPELMNLPAEDYLALIKDYHE